MNVWSSKLARILAGWVAVLGFFVFPQWNWSPVALQQIVEQTVAGLGYDLVEIERSGAGLLRITIDWPWQPPEPGVQPMPEQFITVEDCEKVTRQLQFALEVDGVDYHRLEVSSPGIDRLLRHAGDFVRFAGEVVDITLKAPIGAAAAGQVSANRKKFRGRLEQAEGVDGFVAGNPGVLARTPALHGDEAGVDRRSDARQAAGHDAVTLWRGRDINSQGNASRDQPPLVRLAPGRSLREADKFLGDIGLWPGL